MINNNELADIGHLDSLRDHPASKRSVLEQAAIDLDQACDPKTWTQPIAFSHLLGTEMTVSDAPEVKRPREAVFAHSFDIAKNLRNTPPCHILRTSEDTILNQTVRSTNAPDAALRH
jgi:hypothetical protein